MRKEIFEEGQFYHIYNRGVDKRNIFTDDKERLRFIHALYVLNNFLTIPFRFDLFSLEPKQPLTPISPYVEIVAGCLMPNHYHLMVTPKQKDGISKFFHKVGTSYSHYFNLRHERTGRLFESTFKAKHVDRHEYAVYLTQYIHLNPLGLCRAKLGTDADSEKILNWTARYQWSTLPIYLGSTSPFSHLVSTDFRNAILDMNTKEYRILLNDLGQDLCRA